MYPHMFNKILGTVHNGFQTYYENGNIQTNLSRSYRFWYLYSRHVLVTVNFVV
jgi:hypothetical protein